MPSVPIASPAANIEVKTLVPQNLSKPSNKGKILINPKGSVITHDPGLVKISHYIQPNDIYLMPYFFH